MAFGDRRRILRVDHLVHKRGLLFLAVMRKHIYLLSATSNNQNSIQIPLVMHLDIGKRIIRRRLGDHLCALFEAGQKLISEMTAL